MRDTRPQHSRSPTPLIATGLALLTLSLSGCSSDPRLKLWHEANLDEEFTAEMIGDSVQNFGDFLALEDRLFQQLDELVYAKTNTGPDHALERYSRGSAADPTRRQPNWNRSFEMPVEAPTGGVLLLHGMSDSPYSLRALGEALSQRGFWILGLRLPGHGTAPSGLRRTTWEDMAAVVHLGMRHLRKKVGATPVHVVGYSTGAPLALDSALNAPEGAMPASLVLISPAIRVHPAGALAGWKNTLSALPGLDGWAYLSVMDEFDPYKYNSFATNAGSQVHRITEHVYGRIRALDPDTAARALPPILVLKSTVDATVTTEAVVDNLLLHLPADRNELVLFDINRNAALKATALIADPAPLTNRLRDDDTLPFTVTFVTNESPHGTEMVARQKKAHSADFTTVARLDSKWPRGVVSLSHVALTFPPTDPLYGQTPPEDGGVFLGNLAIKGERGVLKIPADWLLRLRYNPFYDYLQLRVIDWLQSADKP